MNQTIYSVKQINSYLKQTIETDPNLFDVWIKGEISNYTLHKSGHMYFSIKDEGSVLKAVMFAGNTRGLRFIPKNGLKVIVRGGFSVYEPSGQYQINVREMQPDGLGSLHLAFEQLKQKLKDEGLFDEEHKKPIPKFPKTIGIITSPTGAVRLDILTTLKRRYPIAKIIFLPALVQGEQAPQSIVNAIQLMNKHGQADVMIVGRGGGSIEDLWAFNEEKVARAIFESKIPIISAVGHETDTTISDFVSDLRAPTPTGAAELVAKVSVSQLKEEIEMNQMRLRRELMLKVRNKQEKLKQVKQNLLFRHPKKRLEQDMQRLDYAQERLSNLMQKTFTNKQNQLSIQIAKLDALSPLKVMSKGYHVTYSNGKMVKQITDVSVGEKIEVNLVNGILQCTIDEIVEGKNRE